MSRIICVQQTRRGPYWSVVDSFDEDQCDLTDHAFSLFDDLGGWVLIYRRAATILDRPELLTGAYADKRGNPSVPTETDGRIRWYRKARRKITDDDLRLAMAHTSADWINASTLRLLLERVAKFRRPVATWSNLREALTRAQALHLIGPPKRGRHNLIRGAR